MMSQLMMLTATTQNVIGMFFSTTLEMWKIGNEVRNGFTNLQ